MTAIHRSHVTHLGLARLTGLVALVSAVRALALATGVFDPGPAITERLPFHSPGVAGLALALVVAVPMATTAAWIRTEHPHAAEATMLAGILLICWIGVQLMVIRTFTVIQPLMVIVGLAVFAAGLLHNRCTGVSRSGR